MAERIQRRRTKGWRMPENAVYVGRPGRYGNDYCPGALTARFGGGFTKPKTLADCMSLYREDLIRRLQRNPDFLAPLRGKDLVCWCPLDQPCHADVLLEMANA